MRTAAGQLAISAASPYGTGGPSPAARAPDIPFPRLDGPVAYKLVIFDFEGTLADMASPHRVIQAEF